MATKIWLHLASSMPSSRFGYFFHRDIRLLLQPDHNALLVSPHYHLFRDDNPLTSAEYEFITADRCCEKGIPLLAILTFLHLPNEWVCRGICPAVRNVIDVQQMRKALRALPRPMTAAPEGKKERSSASNRGADGVSVGTTRASTISFRIEYPGMTRLPRLLVPQIPHSAPPVDTTVLSLLSTSSCSTTDSEDNLPSSSALPSLTVDVEVSELLSYGPVAQVWRGCLSSGQGTVPVIAKIFSKRKFDDMKNEVLVYQVISSHHLDDLTPLYYGVFTMPDQSWGAIVLSDAGKAFRGSTWEEVGFSAQELQLLWKHVKTLHSLGIHHHDLQPRNVAKGPDGNLRLLDYERSSLGGGSCSCEELSTLEEIFDSLADWRR
ncbi:hypothetical protein EDD85DRAFT_864647 [Armillaria nabsnona]|nr:hypothetical protein EDD85DRAFT_864647 [Armillaria nabsnona]